jgi:hypothetical protein
MATIGPNSAGTVVDDSAVGTVSWTNPSNATASDNSYAVATFTVASTTHYLKATNFGFSIPAGANINGIQIDVERKRVSGAIQNSTVKLVKSGTVVGNNKNATNVNWSTTESYVTFGSSSDLWGTTWTASDINDSTTGFVISATSDGAGEADVDHIRMTVTYTPASTGAFLIGGD